MVQTTLYFIFLDLRKAYDNVDRERLLEILEGYGVGPDVLGLFKFYWDYQRCVAKWGKYHRETFFPYCGATQDGVTFPTLFNVLVDTVVRKWWADVMDEMATVNSGLQGDDVGCMSSLFNANDGAIGSKDHEWLQNATQHLCNLFRDCTGLKPNIEKTETTSCHPREIRGRCLMKGYKRRHEGTGETHSKRKGKRTVCPFPSCCKALALGSLQSHFRT